MTAVLLAVAGAPGAAREVTGAVVAGVSALLYDAGYVLEKQALTALPPVRLTPASLLRTAASSRRWTAGFAAMLAGLGLQVVALTLAPVSVVQPILAGGLVGLAAAGSSLLGERLTARHRWALALVLAAVAAVAVSARGSTALAHAVPPSRFAVLALLVALAAAVAVHRARSGRQALVAAAAAAGLLYGLGAVAEKAVATDVVDRGVVSGALTALTGPYPWLFLAATLAGMVVFQSGLQAHPASLMASLTNVTSTVCALAGAAFVFGEALVPPGWWSAPRLAGGAAVRAAVVLLAADGEAAHVRPPERPLVG